MTRGSNTKTAAVAGLVAAIVAAAGQQVEVVPEPKARVHEPVIKKRGKR